MVFANLTQRDKDAFFALLDEYVRFYLQSLTPKQKSDIGGVYLGTLRRVHIFLMGVKLPRI